MKKNIIHPLHARALILSMILATGLPIGVASAMTDTTYTQSGGSASLADRNFTCTSGDASPVTALNSGAVTLTNCTIVKSGDASSVDNSSQYGTNAGVWAKAAGTVSLIGGTITTNASGGNGLFATGAGSSVTMTNGTISATGGGAHGVDATYTGTITLTNVNITTHGSNSSAVATDFGGGTVTVNGGTISAASTVTGSHSAGIYSTGTITVTGATVSSLADCGGVIDGANTITLVNTSLTGALHGIKTWKTAPMSGTARVTIHGGSLQAQNGDALLVTGETGNAATSSLTFESGAVVTASTGNLVHVVSSSTATVAITADTLTGNLLADATSTLSAALSSGSRLIGTITRGALTLDGSSTWQVTGNATLTTFSDASGISGTTITNITGNGYTVTYNAALSGNSALGGKTYTLQNGGTLTPAGATNVDDAASATPTTWSLSANYPNPFNPSTTLTYAIPVEAQVALTVYNTLGQEVATLVDARQPAGAYTVRFDAAGLASGVYFARLRAGSYLATQKMMLSR